MILIGGSEKKGNSDPGGGGKEGGFCLGGPGGKGGARGGITLSPEVAPHPPGVGEIGPSGKSPKTLTGHDRKVILYPPLSTDRAPVRSIYNACFVFNVDV